MPHPLRFKVNDIGMNEVLGLSGTISLGTPSKPSWWAKDIVDIVQNDSTMVVRADLPTNSGAQEFEATAQPSHTRASNHQSESANHCAASRLCPQTMGSKGRTQPRQ